MKLKLGLKVKFKSPDKLRFKIGLKILKALQQL